MKEKEMEEKVFKIIEEEIKKLEKKRNDYLEVDKNKLANHYQEKLEVYIKILDLMIDGQMYKEIKLKKRDEKLRKLIKEEGESKWN